MRSFLLQIFVACSFLVSSLSLAEDKLIDQLPEDTFLVPKEETITPLTKSDSSAPILLPIEAPVPKPQPTPTPNIRDNHEQWEIANFVSKTYKVSIDNVMHYIDVAIDAGKKFNVEPTLILAIIGIESSFNPHAVSRVGARGLMQVHVRVHQEKFYPYGGLRHVTKPKTNIYVGTEILKDALVSQPSVEKALRRYVGVTKGRPSNYPKKVLHMQEKIKRISHLH